MYGVIWYLDNWCMGKSVRCLRQCPLLAKRIVVSPSSEPAVCLPSRMQQPTWLASVLRAESKPHSHHRLATRHHLHPAKFMCNQIRHLQLQHAVRSRTDASSWGAANERQRALPYRRPKQHVTRQNRLSLRLSGRASPLFSRSPNLSRQLSREGTDA
jgi:hypothetical protein